MILNHHNNKKMRDFKRGPVISSTGFTLIELVLTISLVALLAVIAISKLVDLGANARIAAINALSGAVKGAMNTSLVGVAVNGLGPPSGGTAFTDFGNGFSVRMWNGWPDRWWDGIGIMLQGASPNSGGYLSTQAFSYGKFTFYGYGGLLGDAGWVYTDAPNPVNCSVRYIYDGTGTPNVLITTTGC